MPAPLWEDLDVFLDTDDFALWATITAKGTANTRTVVGIFDDPYINANLGEYDFDTAKPRLLCKETDLVGVRRYDLATVFQKNKRGAVVWSQDFEINTGPQSTGDGMAVLMLATTDQ